MNFLQQKSELEEPDEPPDDATEVECVYWRHLGAALVVARKGAWENVRS